MTRKLFSSFVFSSLIVFSLGASAQAAMFDFVQNADQVAGFDNTAPGNVGENGERGESSGYDFAQGGDPLIVTLRASMLDGTTTDNGNGPYPYFDADFNGPGGLGVCQVLGTLNGSANQCTPSNDDNVTINEVITLDFGTQPVEITQIDFSNGEHEFDFTDAAYLIDQAPTIANFNSNGVVFTPAQSLMIQLTGNVFHFISNSSFGQLNDPPFTEDAAELTAAKRQLYLNVVTAAPVPVPSALILFATGMVALVAGRYLSSRRS